MLTEAGFSYPTRVSPDAENAGYFVGDAENTTESTTSARMIADCIADQLGPEDLKLFQKALSRAMLPAN